MPNYRETLIELQENLNILREREARYAGHAPVELLNQVADYRQAIDLTEQAIAGRLSEAAWRDALKPLLVTIRDRSERAPETCGVTLGDITGGIIGAIIAGRDITAGGDIVTGTKIEQTAHSSDIAQAAAGGHAEVNRSTFDQRGQHVETQYNAGGDIHLPQLAPPGTLVERLRAWLSHLKLRGTGGTRITDTWLIGSKLDIDTRSDDDLPDH